MDTKNRRKPEIVITFKITDAEYKRAEPYIPEKKYLSYWAKNALFEKISRMEANDKKAREQRMITDAAYINELISKGLIHIEAAK